MTRPGGFLQRFRRSERGGALIELAVVLPVLILVAIGIMDYGRVFYTSIAVANAARAGAEWGAQRLGVNSSDFTGMQDFAKLEGAQAAAITVTANRKCRCTATEVSCPTTTDCGGGYGPPAEFIEVTASKTVSLVLKYPGLPTSIPIARTATFRSK
ncbi:MAG TPA: TadE/TadG family type IV pilus assembly protein [Gemmatimonadaceae bacterium]|nr:TadE/TadG family type IV pilus assembly protein [Gemmatimonadaceae bacterium]